MDRLMGCDISLLPKLVKAIAERNIAPATLVLGFDTLANRLIAGCAGFLNSGYLYIV
jgi:hypothetical protein